MASPPQSSYYSEGKDRGAKVQQLFSVVAPRYDLINDLQSLGLHRLWKRRLVGLAEVQPGQRAIDLCCGTGDVAFLLARAGAEVLGVDLNPAMIEIARRRRDRLARGPAQIEFVQADAMALPLPAGQADLVTIAYGLRNLPSFEAALQEMARVLKPGGRLAILDFGKPDNAMLRGAYFAYLRSWVPIFGALFCRDAQAYAYILESLRRYPSPTDLGKLLSRCGFGEVGFENLLGGMMSIHTARRP